MCKDTLDFYKKIKEEDTILSFRGNVSSDLLTSVLQIVESKLERLDEPIKTRRRVYNILVEALQNLYHHTEGQNVEGGIDYNNVTFIVGKEGDIYTIYTGNFIKAENMAKLKTKLEKINSLDVESLKEYYKEVLNNGMMSDKGGGGLGIIDIARKSKHKLDFNFQKVDDSHFFYSLNIKIAQ